jgi:hypothetical protein
MKEEDERKTAKVLTLMTPTPIIRARLKRDRGVPAGVKTDVKPVPIVLHGIHHEETHPLF